MTQSHAQSVADAPDRFKSIRHGWRAMPHALRMTLRRQEQLARTPGFTPIPNKRVEAMAFRALQDARALGHTGTRLEAEAFAMVRRALPMPAFARRHRAPRPSKNDDPAYRAGGDKEGLLG